MGKNKAICFFFCYSCFKFFQVAFDTAYDKNQGKGKHGQEPFRKCKGKKTEIIQRRGEMVSQEVLVVESCTIWYKTLHKVYKWSLHFLLGCKQKSVPLRRICIGSFYLHSKHDCHGVHIINDAVFRQGQCLTQVCVSRTLLSNSPKHVCYNSKWLK